MSELLDLIDEYRKRRGQPSDASIARAIGVAPQTISSWRNRGIKNLPERDTMRRLAEFIGVSYADVFLAAGRDTGYLDPEAGDGHDRDDKPGAASIAGSA